ncbi:glycosyltransferase [Vibrio breoganii]|uniref:glycosyltransferase n=1 Tax=Vibrio breoganii TaxID=553239 RepID=UPI000C85F1DB|nr:glycosyltransferase [Vibrio breoganii]PMM49032.1 hypothetical protein BCT52_03770 [Vibrio breoganii]
MRKVSVCLASYNGENYIRQQIDSILEQLEEHDELIISDDDSIDDTICIISDISDSRVRVLKGPCTGLIDNFENALLAASGDIIILSDQDDVWLPGRVKLARDILVGDTLLSVVDCKIVDRDLNTIDESFFRSRKSKKGLIKNIWKNSYLGCCMAFDKKLLDVSLPFPKDIPMHDWWFGLNAELNGSVIFVNEPYVLYRRHDSNASPTDLSHNSGLSMSIRLKQRLSLTFALMKRHFE